MNSYKVAEHVLRQQSSTKAHEAQLLDARRQRKETDDQLQAMMNRIAFLAQEELRLDRDIEAARRRAAEALARQATRDQEIAATAKDVLAVMPAPAPTKLLRPHTGRSTLLASLSEGASSSASSSSASSSASLAPSLRASTSSISQHPSSNRSPDSGPSLASTSAAAASTVPAPGSSAPSLPAGPGPAGPGPGPGGGGGMSTAAAAGAAAGHPPRAPSASRSRPPVLAGRAADKANKLPPVAPGSASGPGSALLRSPSPAAAGTRPGSASRPSTPGGRSRASPTASPTSSFSSSGAGTRPGSASCRLSADAASAVAASAPLPRPQSGRKALLTQRDGGEGVLASSALHAGGGSTGIAGMQQLPGGTSGLHGTDPWVDLSAAGLAASSGPLSARNAMTLVHGAAELPAADVPTSLSGGGVGGGGVAAGCNAMTVIHGAAQVAGELDGEVVEELLLQGGSRASGGGGGAAVGGPSGLQEFATESGRRVVLVKASRKPEGAATTAAVTAATTAATTVVSAAGVGWGMGGRGAGCAAPIAPREARQLQAELAKKQQIWKVRRTFGLEPTPTSDRTAQVEELGAGAWQ